MKKNIIFTISKHYLLNNSRLSYFLIILFTPLITGVIRKIIPGQPSYIEVLAVIPIIFFIIKFKIFSKKWPIKIIPAFLFYWIFIQVIFAFISVPSDWKVGGISIFTRIIPVLMAWVSFFAINSEEDYVRFSKWFVSISIILLPIGIIAAIFGNAFLPLWLRPINSIVDAGRDFRSGVQSISLLFSSQWILGVSILPIIFISSSNIMLAFETKKKTTYWWLAIISSLILLYLSTRRVMFLVGIVGFIFVILFMIKKVQKKLPQILFVLLILLLIIVFLDKNGLILGKEISSRTEWVFYYDDISIIKRIENVFLPIMSNWLNLTPLGNYLGFAGPEARAVGSLEYKAYSEIVEIGAALLVAEMGLFGLIIFILMNLFIIFFIWFYGRKTKYKSPIYLLLLYFVSYQIIFLSKELLDLTNISIGQFMFWSIPGLATSLIRISSILPKKIVVENK